MARNSGPRSTANAPIGPAQNRVVRCAIYTRKSTEEGLQQEFNSLDAQREGKHSFKTVIIDTIDNAYKFCTDYVLKKFKIEHESDLGYGKGYALINNEFQRVLTKLAFLPCGLFLISHAKEMEMDSRTGKYTRVVPTLPDKARKIVLGMADMVLFCDLEVQTGDDGEPRARRVIRTKPSLYYEAGDRTGRLPETLDLDFSSFLEAFNAATAAKSAAKPVSAGKPAPVAASK